MAFIQDAPADPAFFLHHSNVEWAFYWWQVNNVLRTDITTADTFNCATCAQNMAGYGEPRAEWMGAGYDSENGCIMLPQSSPVACLAYEPFSTLHPQPGAFRGFAGSSSNTEGASASTAAEDCNLLIAKMEVGKCPPEVLPQIARTFHFDKESFVAACKKFPESGRGFVHDECIDEMDRQCEEVAAAVAEDDSHAVHENPENDVERVSGMKCTEALQLCS